MPLDWLNTPLDADIGDLIARKKRAKTIELLRSQLQGRMVPPVQMRLQLADLLVQAGREAEAIPVLIGLADEFAGDGFVAKAIAILKRVDKVQPGRADVESRLASLVKLQRAAPASSSHFGRTPEFGMEEIREEAPATALPDPAGLVEPPPIPDARAAPPPAAETDTTRRVRGVFRRFLASLPGTGASPEPPPPRPSAPAPTLPATPAPKTPPPPSVAEALPSAPPTAMALPSEDTNPDVEASASSGETVPVADDAEPSGITASQPAGVEDADLTENADMTEDSDTTVVEADAIEVDEAEAEAEATAEAAPQSMVADEAIADEDDATSAVETRPDAPAVATAPAADANGVAGRIRGALKWLVSSLGTAEQGGHAPGERLGDAQAASTVPPASDEPAGSPEGAVPSSGATAPAVDERTAEAS